jgi:putative membrane protein
MATSIAGLPDFLLYASVSLVLAALYLTTYTLTTAHNEFALIRENVTSAGISLGLSLLGFALPLASAILNSANILDCAIWGLVALIVQILVYWLVRLLLFRDISERIARGEVPAALFLGCASLTAGIINAASMTY